MAREQLRTASEALERASELADGDAARRLTDQSNQLAALATRDSGPDHGRLARHTNALNELREELEGEAAERVEAAIEAVKNYRETVEGV
ncbi:hypothetical protein ACFQJD_16090 [Haloplanus sp. GCM10025708]|uniref:DUF7553 family protein n=1 Tax=Haloferacaceae TaxID=1644056 RepID=UPI00361FAB00